MTYASRYMDTAHMLGLTMKSFISQYIDDLTLSAEKGLRWCEFKLEFNSSEYEAFKYFGYDVRYDSRHHLTTIRW